ncbi:MAG: hypothetical protein DRQ39_03860 [Gammaproteobacteria bacterium]|nr:MAG: hypothetical protein DRQ39_03860 [Gammaproteobacteria bacterium]RKZ98323.1 MAG: hypothetical protein DRQ46_02430 [Gammaproteobacteria bacterium]
MKQKSLLILVLTVVLFGNSTFAIALTLPPVPTEPIYFEPPVVESTDDVRQMSCVALDNNIRYLHPYRYTYKPGFHEDDANKLATALITFDDVLGGWLGLGYLGYSSLVEEKEQRRMLQVEQQIAMLQQVKAEKHCFE